MSLRDLRLWHHRKALALHATAVRHDEYCASDGSGFHHVKSAMTHARAQARNARRKAAFHENAIAALNTVVSGDVADDLTAAQAAINPSPSEDSQHAADHSAQPA